MKLLISRFGVKSSEIEEAITFDNAMIDKDKPIYVDNEKEPTETDKRFADKFGEAFKDVPPTDFEPIVDNNSTNELNFDTSQQENKPKK